MHYTNIDGRQMRTLYSAILSDGENLREYTLYVAVKSKAKQQFYD